MNSWLDRLAHRFPGSAPRDAALDLPLFPLNTVLFPGGRLSLKVFEPRYVDMVADCLKHSTPFGVCLIQNGTEVVSEVGTAATPAEVGTLAWIESADMAQAGIFNLVVRGGQRFIVEASRVEANQLRRGQLRPKPDETPEPVPAEFAACQRLVERVASEHPELNLAPLRDETPWLGFRLAELLPISLSARQALLEMNDSTMRLRLLLKLMQRSGLG